MSSRPASYYISNRIINTIAEICEALAKYQSLNTIVQVEAMDIAGTLSLEGYQLSASHVVDIAQGISIEHTEEQVRVVRNLYLADKLKGGFDKHSATDFITLHTTLCSGITLPSSISPRFATHLLPCIHPHHTVNMLFSSLINSDYHPLIASCIIHYSLYHISPFAQGSLLAAREWHSMLLSKWRAVFQYIPLNYYLAREKDKYWDIITQQDSPSNCTRFIEFMLSVLLKAVQTQAYRQLTTQDKIIKLIQYDNTVTREQLAVYLNITPDGVKYHLKRLTQAGILKRKGSTRYGTWVVSEPK